MALDGVKVATFLTCEGVKDHLLAVCADTFVTGGVATAATFIYTCYKAVKEANAIIKFHQLPKSKQAAAMVRIFDGEMVKTVIDSLFE
eukprot:gene31970-41469_t